MIKLKGGHITRDPRLDRVPQFDERSKAYRIREIVGERPLRSYTWRLQKYLNQGREGACVGFSLAHEIIARPQENLGVDANYARNRIYKEAQKHDEWPGEDYEGTSVLAGLKVINGLGWIRSYHWALNTNEALQGLAYAGPGIAGLNWYEGMMRPDSNGFIKPTGSIVGGHAILVRGISLRGGYVKLANSWGKSWGLDGDCLLTFDDFNRLLQEDGEFAIPQFRRRVSI